MKITLTDITIELTNLDSSALLLEWTWLIGKRKQPILLSAIGDAFLRDPSDGTVHWLDVGQGQLHFLAASAEEFQARLRDTDFAMMVLQAALVARLRNSGMVLQPGQIYGYKTPPAMGGHYIAPNFQPVDIPVHFTNSGRFHRQIKGLPVAARASFRISG